VLHPPGAADKFPARDDAIIRVGRDDRSRRAGSKTWDTARSQFSRQTGVPGTDPKTDRRRLEMNVLRPVRMLTALGLAGLLALGWSTVIAKAPAAAPAKLGSSLVGKLEGPEVIVDSKTFPKTFKEAPALAEQVKAGKLPSVDKRLPEVSQLLV